MPSANQTRLAELLRSSENTVVLSGAGISTASGIPDFRGAKGLWQEHDPQELATIQVFKEQPQLFWEFYHQRLDIAASVQANPGHLALAELETQGRLQAIITQNIDGLHQKAGNTVVHEIHGNAQRLECLECGSQLPRTQAVFAEDGVPYCPQCQSPLKPTVVLFGELLDLETHGLAYDAVCAADLLICIGSSLLVEPVASLPRTALEHGASLVIINRDHTPYNDLAALSLDGDISEELQGSLAVLNS